MLNINKKLYDYIINDLDAYFEQHQEDVKSNLSNSLNDNRWYLGTYFPKSFKESYVIFSDVFVGLKSYGFCNYDKEINILDLGSGTGGEIYGLLQVLNEKIDKNIKINIYSIDGNKSALQLQENIFKRFWKDNYKNNIINIKTILCEFVTGDDVYGFLRKNFKNNTFDIIMSFKSLSEILKNDENVYYKFLKASENLLKDDGLFILEDVTCDTDTFGCSVKKYIPCTINKNINKYMSSNSSSMNIVIPLCCFYNIYGCDKIECYSQCSTYSYMLTDNKCKEIECKIHYNLFIKNGRLYSKLKEFLSNVKIICSDKCAFSEVNGNECYCSKNIKYKDYFKNNFFDTSQFSLVNILDLYKKYI